MRNAFASLAVLIVLYSDYIPPSLAQHKQTPPAAGSLTIETETKPGQYDYTADVYTERGQINGCGISFHVAWSTDKDVSGASASVTFFILPSKDRVEFAQAIKATGISNGIQKPVTYAWVQTQQYGRTADFTRGPASDPMSFIGWKRNDDNAVFIPLDMAMHGFVLGVNFDGQPLDETVAMPRADQATVKKVGDCFDTIHGRILALLQSITKK